MFFIFKSVINLAAFFIFCFYSFLREKTLKKIVYSKNSCIFAL